MDRRAEARDAAAAGRARAIVARLPDAIAEARSTFGPIDVWLFGSLTGLGAPPHLASDVDIAVRGLPPARVFECAAQLADALGADVDIVMLETAPEALRERVRVDGVAL